MTLDLAELTLSPTSWHSSCKRARGMGASRKKSRRGNNQRKIVGIAEQAYPMTVGNIEQPFHEDFEKEEVQDAPLRRTMDVLISEGEVAVKAQARPLCPEEATDPLEEVARNSLAGQRGKHEAGSASSKAFSRSRKITKPRPSSKVPRRMMRQSVVPVSGRYAKRKGWSRPTFHDNLD